MLNLQVYSGVATVKKTVLTDNKSIVKILRHIRFEMVPKNYYCSLIANYN